MGSAIDRGSGGGDGAAGRRLGGEPERRQEPAHGVGLRHRAQDPPRPGTAVTHELTLAVGAAALGAVYAYLRSRLGLALMALRDSEAASETLGVDVFRTKLTVYLVGAFGTGVTGALLYLNLLRISPDAAFSINWTAYVIFIVVIGGLGSVEGPILGTLIFFLLRELLSDYGAWYLILLGSVAVLVMLVCPQGLWGLVAERWGVSIFPLQRRASA